VRDRRIENDVGNEDAIQLLRSIHASDGDPNAVRRFQAMVWNSHSGDFGPDDEFLRELAYDLDFYEPDPEVRSEDWSYYDKVRLLQLVRDALQQLE
jgi:hypothetical protein